MDQASIDQAEGRELAALLVREGIEPVTFLHVSSTGRRIGLAEGWVLRHGTGGGLALTGDGWLYRCSHRLIRPSRRIWGEPIASPEDLIPTTVRAVVDGSFRHADEAHLRRVKRLPVVTVLTLLPVAAQIAVLATN